MVGAKLALTAVAGASNGSAATLLILHSPPYAPDDPQTSSPRDRLGFMTILNIYLAPFRPSPSSMTSYEFVLCAA
jgi:hypothetical protein